MAYIPEDDEQEQSGMNILAPQGQQNTQQEGQEQPQNASSGQGAMIGSGQAQQGSTGGSQAPKGGSKAKSGMFTNLKKYIDRNKPGAQKMGSKLQKNASQQNQNIQKAVQKQQSDFMSRVNQNRQRMQQAGQFGQQKVEQAQTQQSMPQMQAQEQQLQQRMDTIGPVQDQGGYTQQQADITSAQQAQQQAQQAYQQAQQAQAQQAEQLSQMFNPNEVIQQQSQASIGTSGLEWSDPTYYNQQSLNQTLQGGGGLNAIDQALQSDRATIDALNQKANSTFNVGEFGFQGSPQLNEQENAQLKQAQDRLAAFEAYKQQIAGTEQAQQTQSGALSRLQETQTNLGQAKEQQRLFDNKQALQGELSQLQQKMASAPEQMSESDIQRFNNLRTGIERFDNAMLNLSEQKRGVQGLTEQAEQLGTAQGRRDLMRKEFGAKGGYTAGQASLDNLILSGDKEALKSLVDNSNAQAQQAKSALDEAYRQGRITQDEMTRGTRDLQQQLQSSVEQAQSSFMEGVQQRATTGEGTYIKQLQDKIAGGQGLSAEELNMLGLDQAAYVQSPEELLRDIQINPETFSIQDVATGQDVARASALARLSGESEGENKYLQSELGLSEDQLERIAQRGLIGEGEEFGTTVGELGDTDRAMVEQLAQGTQEQQELAKFSVQKINDLDKQINSFQARRDAHPPGSKDWKYHNHYLTSLTQERSRFKDELKTKYNNAFADDNLMKSESESRYDAFKKLGIK